MPFGQLNVAIQIYNICKWRLGSRGGGGEGLYKRKKTLNIRLGPRVKKNGYPESSKLCNSINLKKYIWCIRNHCIANFSESHNATRANKVW